MSLSDVEWEIRVRGYQHRLIYDPKNPPPKTNFATGASFYSHESYFKNILGELRDKAHGILIPSREYEGPLANSPLPVGATRNPAPDPPTYDVNHFLATRTKQKVPVNKTVSFTVKAGENDPSKKSSVEPTRPYNKIEDWKKGCPYCGDKQKSYDSYRQHISYRCKKKPN